MRERLADDGGAAHHDRAVDRPERRRGASRRASTAAAVAGAKAGRPAARRPRLSGFAPSTSLAGSIAVATSVKSTPGGSGVCSITPCTAGSAASAASCGGCRPALAPRCQVHDVAGDADRRRGLGDGADVPGRGLVRVARTTASRGVRPAAASCRGGARGPRADGGGRLLAAQPSCRIGRRRSSRELRTDRSGHLLGPRREVVDRRQASRSSSRVSASMIPPRLISTLTRAVVAAGASGLGGGRARR